MRARLLIVLTTAAAAWPLLVAIAWAQQPIQCHGVTHQPKGSFPSYVTFGAYLGGVSPGTQVQGQLTGAASGELTIPLPEDRIAMFDIGIPQYGTYNWSIWTSGEQMASGSIQVNDRRQLCFRQMIAAQVNQLPPEQSPSPSPSPSPPPFTSAITTTVAIGQMNEGSGFDLTQGLMIVGLAGAIAGGAALIDISRRDPEPDALGGIMEGFIGMGTVTTDPSAAEKLKEIQESDNYLQYLTEWRDRVLDPNNPYPTLVEIELGHIERSFKGNLDLRNRRAEEYRTMTGESAPPPPEAVVEFIDILFPPPPPPTPPTPPASSTTADDEVGWLTPEEYLQRWEASHPPIQIQMITVDGGQIDGSVTKDQQFQIKIVVPSWMEESADEIEVTLTTEDGTERSITLTRSDDQRPDATFVSEPMTVASGTAGFTGTWGLGAENGEHIAISFGEAAGSFRSYTNEFELAIGNYMEAIEAMGIFLGQVEIQLADSIDPNDQYLLQIAQQKGYLVSQAKKWVNNTTEFFPHQRLYLAQSIWRSLNTQPPGGDIREWSRNTYDSWNQALERGKQEASDAVFRGLGGIIVGAYQAFAESTGAGSLWTALFGQDIFGKDVSTKERLWAVADLAFQVVLMGVGMKIGTMYNVPRMSPRAINRRRMLHSPSGTVANADDFGMIRRATMHAQNVADAHGVIIQVRPTNIASRRWRGLGHPGKPMAIKAKTIDEFDLHLGADPNSVGLVGYFEPRMPTTRPSGMDDAGWTRLQARYNERMTEFNDPAMRAKMDHMIHEGQIRIDQGVVIDTGLCGGTGKGITGDHDLWRITDRAGRPLPAAKVEEIVNDLRNGPFAAQHGCHTDWKIDPRSYSTPEAYQTDLRVDRGVRAKHEPGGDALIQFNPGRTPTTAYEGKVGLGGTRPASSTTTSTTSRPSVGTAGPAAIGAAERLHRPSTATDEQRRTELMTHQTHVSEADRLLGIAEEETNAARADDAARRAAAHYQRAAELRRRYLSRLPIRPVARSPFNSSVVERRIDTAGIDGLWWNSEAPVRGIQFSPPGFIGMTGALRIQGDVAWTPFPVTVGPQAPFVVTRLLEKDDVSAVIKGIDIAGAEGWTICYFCRDDSALPAVPEWGRSESVFIDIDGHLGWTAPVLTQEDFDFDLGPWIRDGKLLWISPDDADMTLRSDVEGCPYVVSAEADELKVLTYFEGRKYLT